jgi:hypothetical protein
LLFLPNVTVWLKVLELVEPFGINPQLPAAKLFPTLRIPELKEGGIPI